MLRYLPRSGGRLACFLATGSALGLEGPTGPFTEDISAGPSRRPDTQGTGREDGEVEPLKDGCLMVDLLPKEALKFLNERGEARA